MFYISKLTSPNSQYSCTCLRQVTLLEGKNKKNSPVMFGGTEEEPTPSPSQRDGSWNDSVEDCFWCFCFLRVSLSGRRGPVVGKQLVEARLQPEAWRQQAEARSAKLSKRVLSCFCLILKNSLIATPHSQRENVFVIVIVFVNNSQLSTLHSPLSTLTFKLPPSTGRAGVGLLIHLPQFLCRPFPREQLHTLQSVLSLLFIPCKVSL